MFKYIKFIKQNIYVHIIRKNNQIQKIYFFTDIGQFNKLKYAAIFDL